MIQLHPVAVPVRTSLLGILAVVLSVAGAASAACAEPRGRLSGTVRAGGEPVASAWVALMPVTPTGAWAGQPAHTTTDQEGRYEFEDMDASHVKVQARAPALSGLASTYWPDAYSFATAGIIPVASSGSTADLDLPLGGSIEGRVVDADTGDPIVGVRVAAHVEASAGWEAVGSAGSTSVPGRFVIEGLPPAAVALAARTPAGSNYLGNWYDGAGFYGEATLVEPGSREVVLALRSGGELRGTVRDDLGVPVPGAVVTVVGCLALCPRGVTDSAGTFQINAVPAGPGLRAFADGTGAGLLNQWYSAPGQRGDTTFDLAAGQVRGDLDFTLTAGALATALILDGETGEPIPGVSVDLVDVANPLHSFGSRVAQGSVRQSPAAPATAAASTPEVSIGPVPPGVYFVTVYPGADNNVYLPVELVASTGLDGARRIDLARGERATFTVSLARRQVASGAPVTGCVTDSADPAGGLEAPANSAMWPGLFGGFLVAPGASFLGVGA